MKVFPLQCKSIEDNPAFAYRGMHLDVARHFFTVAEVKKYLDYMAYYKFNHFHWHLTDDQGWRIEIKKYPKLQEHAAYRNETLIGHYNDQPHKFDGVKYGGYYTQDEIKEVVLYAADRNITVIPEIEMPGHALAALAAYPELGCEVKKYETATKWGVFEDVFCPYDTTFRFLEGVIDEVVSLFPGKYIHIGGDECPKDSWRKSEFCQQLIKDNNLKDEHELQSYFIKKMEKYINGKGKQIIGWDEILEGGLSPNATVMSWRGVQGGIDAATLHHDVIMTPGSHCYFDYYQSENPTEPLAIGGLTTIDKVYHWNPIPETLAAENHKYILGGQSNLWSEYIHTYSGVEYMVYARGMAMSEALWSTSKNYDGFLSRFERHADFWKSKGAKVAMHIYDIKPRFKAGTGKGVELSFVTPQDANQGPASVINGVQGSNAKYGGSEWLGFSGNDVSGTIDLGKNTSINELKFRFFKGEGQWIYLPKSLEIEFSSNGEKADTTLVINDIKSDTKVTEVIVNAGVNETRFIKFRAKNYGIIPEGAQGSGHPAWLFIDEITVR
ncbi:MAG: family 20 glycosylhydrolase [Saprospiraceae bacterium]|nr:family 20 glycosylhydrolase [Saprospiraceae bacterium]